MSFQISLGCRPCGQRTAAETRAGAGGGDTQATAEDGNGDVCYALSSAGLARDVPDVVARFSLTSDVPRHGRYLRRCWLLFTEQCNLL